MAFFFPEVYAAIDWSRGYTFLDKEFQKISRTAKTGKRFVDKLVQVYLLTGDEAWILIHLEIQGKVEMGFEERIFVYHYRIYDTYHRPVVSLAILTDDQANWHPNQFSYNLCGCSIQLTFPTAKLLNYRHVMAELENHSNPFALVTLAHLKTQTTHRNPNERYAAKFNLIRLLYSRGYSERKIYELLRFIDWVMTLPPQLELQLQTEIEQIEMEAKMQYITSFERIGEQRGLAKGKAEGKAEGTAEGKAEQSRQAILDVLTIRFEFVPEAIGALLLGIKEIEVLRELHRQAVLSPSLSKFEQYLPTPHHS